jgi:hypothetical protein
MNPYIQVFIAISIVIILFVVAFYLYNKEQIEAIRQTGILKKSTPIFSGIVDFADSSDVVYNTLDPSYPNYLNMGSSVNQTAGTEYSYNFWLYIDNTSNDIFAASTDATNSTQVFPDVGLEVAADVKNLPFVLFMRGSNKVLEMNNLCSISGTDGISTNSTNTRKQDILVKAPLIKLEHGGDILTVEFNTMGNPDGVRTGARNTCADINTNWKYINSYKVGLKNMSNTQYSKQWFMVTVTLQDTYPSDPYPIRNKVKCSIFVNGTLSLDQYINGQLGDPTNISSTPLRLNQGNIYINPTLKNGDQDMSLSRISNQQLRPLKNKLMMADLTYYNYKLSPSEITALFGNQFNKSLAQLASQTNKTDDAYLKVTEIISSATKPIEA